MTVSRPCVSRERTNNAELSNITHVAPRTIAYAAVQVRHTYLLTLNNELNHKFQLFIRRALCCFMLSSTEQWTPTDGSFDMNEFFTVVVGLFQSQPDKPWAVETLQWGNGQVSAYSTFPVY